MLGDPRRRLLTAGAGSRTARAGDGRPVLPPALALSAHSAGGGPRHPTARMRA